MIGKLTGIIDFVHQDYVILDVSNVGYLIYVPQSNSYSIGEKMSFWIYTHVREDNISLFGFNSEKIKNLFLILMNVNGIGAKFANLILSHLSASELVNAIHSQNFAILKSVPGIGSKIAERMVLELKNNKEIKQLYFDLEEKPIYNQEIANGAIEALVQLGIHYNTACKNVYSVVKKDVDLNSLDEVVRRALQMNDDLSIK